MRSVGVAFSCMLTLLASAAAAQNSAPTASAAQPAAPAPSAAPKAPPKATTPAPKATATANTPPGPGDKTTPAPGAAAPAAPPAAAAGAAASGSAPAPAPAAPPAAPDTSAPPLYYVEPPAPPPGFPQDVYEPQPPMYMPEPPPPPSSRNAPASTALWAGVRVGALIPFGALWVDGFSGYYHQRSFSYYAATGPVFELDLGARLASHYNLFALWEHAALSTGSLDRDAWGGQEWGATNLYGIGARFSSDPSGVGFVTEIALGYREFHAYWSNGTELAMTDGWFDARLGLGVEFRVNPWLSLSPMVVLGGGSFDDAKWSGPGKSGNALTPYDSGGGYGTVSFTLGAHADVF